MNIDIHFTDDQGNEFYVGVRQNEVQVWKNKTQLNDVRFYPEDPKLGMFIDGDEWEREMGR
jgi:hypothetical protein